MEHRWGQRHALQNRVLIRTLEGSPVNGQLDNMSVSGAFIVTPVPPPPFCQVHVAIYRSATEHHPAWEISGRIVRHTQHGFGIEWDELVPEILRALLAGRLPADPSLRDLPEQLISAA